MRVILILCATICLQISCKQANQPTAASNASSTTQSEARTNASAIIDFRVKEEPEAASVIVADYWKYLFIYENGGMSKPGQHDGRWLDFKDDFTYEYGEKGKSTGGGRYHHSFETNLLVFLDNDPSIEPTEFQTKFGGDLMILIGKPTYGNNGVQMKLERIAEKPQ